jgi:aspartyl-tRNA(Asn)/glutamyl-tRNA(Gln) amidotransferase subunit A
MTAGASVRRDDLAFLTIAEAARLIRSRQVSPVELTRVVLERIDRYDGRLHSYITVLADSALDRARVAEQELRDGTDRGPLHGIPLGLKDLIDVAGVPTTAGSGVLVDNVPTEHATTTAKLIDAGAVIVGKQNLHEFAYGYSNVNPRFGTPSTPWKIGYCSGGSSGGTGSAVAAGLCFGGLGSDTGGSIRVPSAWCGISGLKPTTGRVSVKGVVALSWTLDHIGPMARTAEDCGLLLNAVAGYDPSDPGSFDRPIDDYTSGVGGDLRGKRIGVIRDFLEHPRLEPDVAVAVRQAIGVLGDLGAVLVDVSLPDSDLDVDTDAVFAIIATEASAYHAEWVATRPNGYGLGLVERLRRGADTSPTKLARAYRLAYERRRAYDSLMADLDALVGPTTPFTSVPIDVSGQEIAGTSLFTVSSDQNDPGKLEALLQVRRVGIFDIPFDLNGLPTLSVPCGFDSNGLPYSVMIVGRRWGEREIVEIGHAYQQATDWHRRRPPID